MPCTALSVTRVKYFSLSVHSRNRIKQARKIARSTQLQGCNDSSLSPTRRPKPSQCTQECAAKASVSDRVHSMLFFPLPATRFHPIGLFFSAYAFGIISQEISHDFFLSAWLEKWFSVVCSRFLTCYHSTISTMVTNEILLNC